MRKTIAEIDCLPLVESWSLRCESWARESWVDFSALLWVNGKIFHTVLQLVSRIWVSLIDLGPHICISPIGPNTIRWDLQKKRDKAIVQLSFNSGPITVAMFSLAALSQHLAVPPSVQESWHLVGFMKLTCCRMTAIPRCTALLLQAFWTRVTITSATCQSGKAFITVLPQMGWEGPPSIQFPVLHGVLPAFHRQSVCSCSVDVWSVL